MRLTNKTDDGYVFNPKANKESDEYFSNIHMMMDKLGSLEDVEEELGIDLVTLFKVLKQGNIWIKTKSGDIVNSCEFSLDCNGVGIGSYQFINGGEETTQWVIRRLGFVEFYLFKDYGKTWALTKEELL